MATKRPRAPRGRYGARAIGWSAPLSSYSLARDRCHEACSPHESTAQHPALARKEVILVIYVSPGQIVSHLAEPQRPHYTSDFLAKGQHNPMVIPLAPISTEGRLAREFSASDTRLIRVAYAVIGTHADAKDIVSECWRGLVKASAQAPIDDVAAWIVAVTRRALDALRADQPRRETCIGPRLQESTLQCAATTQQDPADRVTLDQTVCFALIGVMETKVAHL
ncbi:sigma factor [Rhodococcus sp. NM-2]|uniref:sigma factor n=1 Tax=Rhodococcus sp. NM-2 TaxID=3401174 RepID=UPI003AAAA5BF